MHHILCVLQHRQIQNRAIIQSVVDRIKQRLEALNPAPSNQGTPCSKLIVDDDQEDDDDDLSNNVDDDIEERDDTDTDEDQNEDDANNQDAV